MIQFTCQFKGAWTAGHKWGRQKEKEPPMGKMLAKSKNKRWIA
jgi:hypothetical protein